MPLLLLIFVVVPLIEISLFITVGGAIGLGPTLAIVILTAIFGSWLLRREGARALIDVQRAFVEFRDPTAPLAHGALILVAGVLLISPGFFTDTLGLLLLIPTVREAVLRRTGRRVMSRVRSGFTAHPNEFSDDPNGTTPHRYGRGVVIDAEFVETAEPEPQPGDGGGQDRGPGPRSGWERG